MQLKNDEIVTLILKYLSGELTAEEQQQLQLWAGASEANQRLLAEFSDEEQVKTELLRILDARNSIWEQVQAQTTTPVKQISYARKYWYAAAVAGLLIAGGFGYYRYQQPEVTVTAPYQTGKLTADIPSPAGTQAYITLSNGKRVYIDSIQTGTGIGTGKKLGDDSIVYQDNHTKQPEPATITVPRGSRPLRVTLPDGSGLTVNVATTVTFMVPFTNNERLVNISGEAYFDVVPSTRPFIVKTAKGQQITVLGTAFNIKSYEDESTTKTTLVTGKIQVSQNNSGTMKMLTAGQQAIASDNKIQVQEDADLEEALAWQHQQFRFNHEELKSVLKQLARWYNVEIVYEGTIPPRYFTVSISRDKSLATILTLMELNGIRFRLEGKRLIVLP
ncbi:FecR family protein [Chitinophaga jiangningensis]|uniref:FecR family protein n=1 Tax=Chitinophaga jiangningensis TaxID=1419482 RepID=A0A1M7BRL5_9BACT|nr:FecR family protein [Chitinophaga jiangningensis]SHL57678.1 FecR family protein [Chitinophaga jiangningensis]